MCLIGRVTLGNCPDDGEGVKYVNNVQDRGHGQTGHDQGNCDVKKLRPEACAVHFAGFVQGRVDALQAGQNAEGNKGYRDENTDKAFPGEERVGG